MITRHGPLLVDLQQVSGNLTPGVKSNHPLSRQGGVEYDGSQDALDILLRLAPGMLHTHRATTAGSAPDQSLQGNRARALEQAEEYEEAFSLTR